MKSAKTPREEYLRKRYLKLGPRGFMPKDALELLLGYCFTGPELYNVIDALFDRFGALDNILNADARELLEVSGMTESAAVLISMLPKLHRINSFSRASGFRITDAASVCDYFIGAFRGVNTEQFKVACLDDRFTVRRCITAGKGTTFGVNINIDGIIGEVLKSQCHICVVAHNHPGGSCMPSETDVISTKRLISAFKEAGIDVLDHIILGREGARSMLDLSESGGKIFPLPKY